jgi:transcriptional regulator with XRE-family HTH domain
MTRAPSPTVSRRWLALEMRRLRKERHLSQAAVADALGCQVPKVSLMENGQRPLQEADLETLIDLFQIPDEERQLYLDEFKNAQGKGWWELYDEDTVPTWYRDFIGLEQGAERIRAYQPAVIHGLFHTEDYAASLYRDATAGLSEEKIARRVEIRRRRQAVLDRKPEPPRLDVILDESALLRRVGDHATTKAQLERVVALCESNENITVRVAPFDRGGAYEAADGAFTIFSLPHGDPGVVYRERRTGAEFLDSPLEIDGHSLTFQRLSALALTPEESVAAINDRIWGRMPQAPLGTG